VDFTEYTLTHFCLHREQDNVTVLLIPDHEPIHGEVKSLLGEPTVLPTLLF
jgi:hypothetical protein